MKVVIAGASGFIGSELMRALPEAIGISRQEPKSPRWVFADLFSRTLTQNALQGCDVAIYLVHSMLPTSHLDQGDFQDFDLIIADNFARACKLNGVKQIIYLSGIIPVQEELSKHLRSRKEVEDILKTSAIPVTTLRAGLIIGDQGSSFNILKKLALKTPLVVFPSWLNTRMEPVGLKQIIESIKFCIGNESVLNRTYDLGSGTEISYQELFLLTRKLAHKSVRYGSFFIPTILAMWIIRLITKAPRNLILPLIDSLQHNMTVRNDRRLILPHFNSPSLPELLTQALNSQDNIPHAFKKRPNNKVVRSIQRINVKCRPQNRIYQLYFNWLSSFFNPFFKVDLTKETCTFKFLNISLLVLQHVPASSEDRRELLSITGGLLSSRNQKYGRLEFRKFPECIICAIHDYMPALPWYIYVYTQALVHQFVMKRFTAYLIRTKICDEQKDA